jgi:hypothetical protein
MQAETGWPAFAGIDWGGDHHQLCVVDASGVKQVELRVTHDVPGLRELDDELARFVAVLPVAIERGEGLLVEHLQAQGHLVFACRHVSRLELASAIGSRPSRTTASTRSSSPTRCVTSTPTGGPCQSRHRCWPRCVS